MYMPMQRRQSIGQWPTKIVLILLELSQDMKTPILKISSHNPMSRERWFCQAIIFVIQRRTVNPQCKTTLYTGRLVLKKTCFSAWASTLNMGLINRGWYGMFVACGIWCLADVSSVSPSSEHKFYITNYLNTDFPTIPQSAVAASACTCSRDWRSRLWTTSPVCTVSPLGPVFGCCILALCQLCSYKILQ